jgi:hypothetical protein
MPAQWKSDCLKALLEADNTKVLSRILAARCSIAQRLQGSAGISENERSEIERALHKLHALEVERQKLLTETVVRGLETSKTAKT